MNVVVANDISEVDRLHRNVSLFCREHGLSSEIEVDSHTGRARAIVDSHGGCQEGNELASSL
jgi:hypothetical protein